MNFNKKALDDVKKKPDFNSQKPAFWHKENEEPISSKNLHDDKLSDIYIISILDMENNPNEQIKAIATLESAIQYCNEYHISKYGYDILDQLKDAAANSKNDSSMMYRHQWSQKECSYSITKVEYVN